ncbi:Leucine-rich_repeat domain superfamily [Hexamita inflata]|uniref:Leucine-rich repeat domain superfamily n=1 Tax=Hexamita inflata TaxID=28002 RepID=A0AA86UQ78_9EUKA|nr:Leucine-rich repeat domain superfamily [Hexamita inflata]
MYVRDFSNVFSFSNALQRLSQFSNAYWLALLVSHKFQYFKDIKSFILNLVGIEQMKQLTHLNIKNNFIITIKPLQELSNLKHLQLDNNFTHDPNTLTSHQNYSLE